MKLTWFLPLAVILTALLLASCNNKPIYPIVPEIAFERMSKDTVAEFENFQFNFSYKDGDGDLGKPEPDTLNYDLFIQDMRTDTRPEGVDSILRYNLPYLTPAARTPSIKGSIQVNLQGGTAILNNNLSSQTFVFKIWIYDRAGHKSNVITTTPFTVKR